MKLKKKTFLTFNMHVSRAFLLKILFAYFKCLLLRV